MRARHYGMDWLRIGAFGLLIFYHIGMFFVHWDWHVKTARLMEGAAVPMLATSAWRIPLLFIVSGYATAALLERGTELARFVRDRSARLLIPLVFAMAVIVPPQPWVELMFKHGYLHGYLHFWWSGEDPTHALVDDWGAHRVFLPMFLFGYLLRDAEAVWAGIRRWWKAAALLALAGYAAVAAVEIAYPGRARPPFELIVLFAAGRIVLGWCAIVALIGIADRFWNRDHPWRATLTEAVFPFYIIHQTIIVLVGWWLLPLAFPPLAEFAILAPVTAAGCWLFYAVGRRVGWLRPLIGLRGRAA